MFCGKCGTEVNEEARICPNCGNALKGNGEAKKLNLDQLKNIPKKHIIIACILVVVIAVPTIYFSMPSTKIIKSLKAGDYEDAEDMYYDKYKGGKGDFLLNKALVKMAKKCEEDFTNSKISEESAIEQINAIRNIRVDAIASDIDEIYSSMDRLIADRNIIKNAEEYYNNGNYYMAISTYNSLSQDSPLYESALEKIEEVKNKYKSDIIEKIDGYIKDDRPRDLANYINNNINGLNDSEISSEIMNKYYTYLQTKTDKLLSKDLYDDASSLLSYAENNFPEDSKIKEMADNLEDKYVDLALKKAETEFGQKNYEVAATTVQAAMQQVEDNEQLSNKYNEYKAYLPAYINDLDYFNKNGSIYTNSSFSKLADNTGKEYGRAYCVENWGSESGSAEYLINGNYTNFEGVCGVAYDNRTTEYSKFFEVYGDGVLLYTSPTFSAGTMPKSFNIDISNVKLLKILYPDSNGENKIATIFDGRLYNKNNVEKNAGNDNSSEATS